MDEIKEENIEKKKKKEEAFSHPNLIACARPKQRIPCT